ncbi:hypothetical protein MMC07_008024 [Pseudocyphellaria aurata]|nr:hypothetical protein [Pseudocyphellaria aurata]
MDQSLCDGPITHAVPKPWKDCATVGNFFRVAEEAWGAFVEDQFQEDSHYFDNALAPSDKKPLLVAVRVLLKDFGRPRGNRVFAKTLQGATQPLLAQSIVRFSSIVSSTLLSFHPYQMAITRNSSRALSTTPQVEDSQGPIAQDPKAPSYFANSHTLRPNDVPAPPLSLLRGARSMARQES